MAVTIRLTRGGAKKTPFYRIAVADSRNARDGRFIEQIGVYDPLRNPPEIRFDAGRVEHWMKMGARPSETVGQLLRAVRRAALAAPKAQ